MSTVPARSRNWLLPVLLVGPFMAQADATIANVATTPALAVPALATPADRVHGRDSARPWRDDLNS